MADVFLETEVIVVDATELNDGDTGLMLVLNVPQTSFLAALGPNRSLCFQSGSGEYIAVKDLSIARVQPIDAKAMIGVKKSQAPFIAKGTRVRIQRTGIA